MNFWKSVEFNAHKWIKEAALIIKDSFKEQLIIDEKTNKSDLVTNIDKKVEQFFIEKIKTEYSNHKILGEEGYGHNLDNLDGIVWIIDPIDGTMNFVHQRRNFAITIGIYNDGVGMIGFIYDVALDEMYIGRRGEGAFLNGVKLPQLTEKTVDEAIVGISASWLTNNSKINPEIIGRIVRDSLCTRSYGSAAIEMAYIASGRVDVYISMSLAPWDYAGGKIIIEELGGIATQLSGKPLSMLNSCPVIVARPGLHEQILNEYVKPYK